MCQVSQYYRLALTEVNELNLPADPCNTDPDNRFHDCNRKNVSGQVKSQGDLFWWSYLSRWDVGPSGTGGVTRIFQVAQRQNNSDKTSRPLAFSLLSEYLSGNTRES